MGNCFNCKVASLCKVTTTLIWAQGIVYDQHGQRSDLGSHSTVMSSILMLGRQTKEEDICYPVVEQLDKPWQAQGNDMINMAIHPDLADFVSCSTVLSTDAVVTIRMMTYTRWRKI